MNTKPKNTGFTLIETVVYIALLGLVMTGALVTSYDLIWGAGRSTNKTTAQEEGSFVERKFAWALADMSAAPLLGGSGCNQTLSVVKTHYPENPIEFRRNAASSSVEMREGGSGVYSALTTENVSVSCVQFSPIPASGSAPAGVGVTITIGGFEFSVTRYVRQ